MREHCLECRAEILALRYALTQTKPMSEKPGLELYCSMCELPMCVFHLAVCASFLYLHINISLALCSGYLVHINIFPSKQFSCECVCVYVFFLRLKTLSLQYVYKCVSVKECVHVLCMCVCVCLSHL